MSTAVGLRAGFSRHTTIAFALSVLFLLSIGTHPAAANGPEAGWDGGSLIPLESSTIRLLGERVWVRLEEEGYPGGQVRVEYWLHNPSSGNVSFEMTFLMSPGPLGPGYNDPSWKHDYGFQAWLRGDIIPLKWRPASPGAWTEFTTAAIDSLPVWQLTIPAGDTTRLNFEYRVHGVGGAEGNNYGFQFQYLARPAALWAGRLEFAEFDIHVGRFASDVLNRDPWTAECGEIRIEPAGWFWNAGRLHWRFEDWEPDQDFVIHLNCISPTSTSEFLAESPYPEIQGISLPPFAADRERFNRNQILSEILESFLKQRIGEPVRSNYVPFAMIYLVVRRHEIAARRGAMFADDHLQRFFLSLPWYTIQPSYSSQVLNSVEKSNWELLKQLESEIIADRRVLRDLPAGRDY